LGVSNSDDLVRVFVCDDSVGYATMLSGWATSVDGIELVGVAASAQEMLRQVPAARPDVILLDLMLPEGPSSPELVGELRAMAPGVRIVLLSSMPDERLTDEAARVGADAHSSKMTSVDGLYTLVTGRD
jgi:DNA-binding NarL/FixJ family response regulator